MGSIQSKKFTQSPITGISYMNLASNIVGTIKYKNRLKYKVQVSFGSFQCGWECYCYILLLKY